MVADAVSLLRHIGSAHRSKRDTGRKGTGLTQLCQCVVCVQIKGKDDVGRVSEKDQCIPYERDKKERWPFLCLKSRWHSIHVP